MHQIEEQARMETDEPLAAAVCFQQSYRKKNFCSSTRLSRDNVASEIQSVTPWAHSKESPCSSAVQGFNMGEV